MNRRHLRLVPIVMLAALIAFVLSGATSTTHAQSNEDQRGGEGQACADQENDNPCVAPRNSTPHGMTYEEWAGALLHWAFSQPVGVGLMMDSTGQLTQQRESGKVWFLPGPSEALPQPENLSLTVPEGTALFFSPVGFYGSGPNPGQCPTPQACVDWVKTHPLAGGAAAQGVEIDGVTVPNINDYLILSPVVPLLNAGDPFSGLAVPDTFGVFGGFGLFIEHLPPGQHVLHARTTVHFGAVQNEITYTITVTSKDEEGSE
jgi:hypothetical protein